MASNLKTVVVSIALGSIAWLVAGAVAAAKDADSKIIWTCAVGATLGVIGIRYSIRRNGRSRI